MINLDFSNFLKKNEIKNLFSSYKKQVNELSVSIENRKCLGNEMLGWLDYPFEYNKDEIQKLINLAKEWNKNSKIKNVVMLGIGGSYIGVRSAIDMVLPEFNRSKKIYYVSSLSSSYIKNLVDKLIKEDFYLIVISKSGTTLEIGIAFRIFYNLLFEKFGSEGSKERIVCITDANKGVLRKIVNEHKLNSFSLPENVGGRFSAITPVGLFAMQVMGVNANNILEGAKKALEDTKSHDLTKNLAYQYAVFRHYMYTKKEKTVEVYCVIDDAMKFFTEHLKQLFAESEGKNNKGLLPTNCIFTTDLHSVGQYLQDGKKIFFETYIYVEKPLHDFKINSFISKLDGLSFLENKTIDEVNKIAANSTIDAHRIEGKVDILKIIIEKRDEKNFGYLYSWFSKAVAMSALLLEVNPFDQPGVEAYKKRMFSNLGKK